MLEDVTFQKRLANVILMYMSAQVMQRLQRLSKTQNKRHGKGHTDSGPTAFLLRTNKDTAIYINSYRSAGIN
jgi:hypothetical protein